MNWCVLTFGFAFIRYTAFVFAVGMIIAVTAAGVAQSPKVSAKARGRAEWLVLLGLILGIGAVLAFLVLAFGCLSH